MKADILECYDSTLISKVIEDVTKSNISHTAIMVDSIFVAEASCKGVRITQLAEKNGKYIILRYEGLNEQQQTQIIEYIKSKLGSRYDYFKLISLLFYKLFNIKIPFQIKNMYICSELIWEGYMSIGIDIAPHIEDDVYLVPGDLMNSPVLIKVPM